MSFTSPAETAAWLTETANVFMRGPDNDIHMPSGPEPAFDLPLIGFAAGDDPLWDAYKEHVGPYHWTPVEAFRLKYPDTDAAPSELFVMSWILPQTEATRRDHKKERNWPAERWARSRIFGEEFVNQGLRRHMLAALEAQGVQALAPFMLEEWKSLPSDAFVIASTWSERHAAHAAGLGTFGLCDGLITPVGKAMRTGSVVMRLAVPVTERPYTHHREYCLFYTQGTCGACIKRCPVDALGPEGHDKVKCREFVHHVTARYVEENWHFKGYGCGLCQVGVPCESGVPRRKSK